MTHKCPLWSLKGGTIGVFFQMYSSNSPASVRSQSRSRANTLHICSGHTRIMAYGSVVMLTLDDLKHQVCEVQRGGISLDEFEDWFRTNSRVAYASDDRALSNAAA